MTIISATIVTDSYITRISYRYRLRRIVGRSISVSGISRDRSRISGRRIHWSRSPIGRSRRRHDSANRLERSRGESDRCAGYGADGGTDTEQ
jgi:hypothetical protein